jgi:hypothetical protein
MWRFVHLHPDTGPPRELATAAVVAETKRNLPRLRARAAVASYDQWHLFLCRVAAMTVNPPMNEDGLNAFDFFVAEVHGSSMRGTCLGALVDGLGECQRERMFPKPEALNRILGPLHRRAVAELAAAENIIRSPGHAKPREGERREPLTEEQRRANREKIARERAIVGEESPQMTVMQLQRQLEKYPPMPDEMRVLAMQREVQEINDRIKAGLAGSGDLDRRSHLWLRLTNIERQKNGEPAFTVADWARRQQQRDPDRRANL